MLKTKCETQKSELVAQKKSDSAWTEDLQDLLDEVVGFIADIEEAIEEVKSNENNYDVPKYLEKHIHILIHHGNSYSPVTGELISKKHVQVLSYSEWNFFKKSFKRLGYTIDKVLHDPYGEVAKYVK